MSRIFGVKETVRFWRLSQGIQGYIIAPTQFANKTWVIKKYFPSTLKTIEDIEQTAESHTKKVVQMHHLAASMAYSLSVAVKKTKNQELFGEFF